MRVFLTGATGYIGSAVRRALCARGHDVVALVRRSEQAQQLENEQVTPVIGDMHRPSEWMAHASPCDAMVHVAQVRLGRRVGNAWVARAERADQSALAALVQAAEHGGRCRSLIYTSGVSAFGDHGDAWIDEQVSGAPGPIGRYHLAGERAALDAARRGVPAVVLRPALPYGPGGTFASHFLTPAAKGRFNHVGAGDNFFPCEHLDDLAEGYTLAVEKPPVGQVVALVDDEPLRMKDIGQLLLRQFRGGKPSGAPRWLVGLLAGAPLARMLSESYRVRNARAKALLGWKPRYPTLREGLPEVVAEYRRRA